MDLVALGLEIAHLALQLLQAQQAGQAQDADKVARLRQLLDTVESDRDLLEERLLGDLPAK